MPARWAPASHARAQRDGTQAAGGAQDDQACVHLSAPPPQANSDRRELGWADNPNSSAVSTQKQGEPLPSLKGKGQYRIKLEEVAGKLQGSEFQMAKAPAPQRKRGSVLTTFLSDSWWPNQDPSQQDYLYALWFIWQICMGCHAVPLEMKACSRDHQGPLPPMPWTILQPYLRMEIVVVAHTPSVRSVSSARATCSIISASAEGHRVFSGPGKSQPM